MKVVEKIGLIADDLTGANDTAVQFAKQGLRTIVLADVRDPIRVALSSDVIVIDTESRNSNREKACENVRAAVRRLVEMGVQKFYKKVDSTLRGNIGAELETIIDELDAEVCIFTPAFPANGRTVVGGYLLVNHVPLEKTEIIRKWPMRATSSHIPTILESQTELEIGHIPLSEIMKGIANVENQIDDLKKDARIIVADAVTYQDLRVVARAAVTSNTDQLLSGSAGLAEVLPEAFGLHTSLPVLVIAGSPCATTTQQIAKASEELNAAILDLNPPRTLSKNEAEDEIQRVSNEATRLLKSGTDVIITPCRVEDSLTTTIQKGRMLGIDQTKAMQMVASALGKSCVNALEQAKVAGLILTGGDIAIETLRILGGVGVRVIDEVLSGIPSGRIMGGKCDGLSIITKAGAFGDSEAITKSIRYLRRMNTQDSA